MKKYGFTVILLIVIAAVGLLITNAYVNKQDASRPENGEDRLSVVTSFYPMYIAAENVVGELADGEISLSNLSEPQTGCLHDYQLTPEDMKDLSTADVFIYNGGGAENFILDIAENYPNLILIDAGQYLEGDNSHYWMSVTDYSLQVQTIAEGLAAADPDHADIYQSNAADYQAKLGNLQAQIGELRDTLQGKKVILFHEAYEYLAEDLGMEVVQIMDMDEERQISAGEVAQVVEAVQSGQVELLLVEELYGADMAQTVARETGVTVIYLDTLVRGEYDADSYINGMQENISLLQEYVK